MTNITWPEWIYRVTKHKAMQCSETRRVSIDGGPWLEVWA